MYTNNTTPTVITSNGFSIYPQVSENRKGSYGVVVDAVRLSDGKEFVMKFFGYTKQKPDVAYILREVDNLQMLRSESGVAHIETVFNDTIEGIISQTIPKLHRRIYPVIVMEKLKGGELFESILSKQDQGDKFSEYDAAIIFKTFITALDKIHTEKNMIVVDLKSENLVFADNKNYNSIKVIDFGMAVCMSDRTEHYDDTLSGTGAYLAPESIYHHQKYGQAMFSRSTDIWQCSCILFTLLTVSFPFGSNHTPNLHERIKKCMFINRDLPSIQARYKLSSEVTDLFSKMFQMDPSKRLTCKEILNHPWILHRSETNPFGDDYFDRLRSFQCQRKFKQILNQSTILSIQQQLQAELSTTRYVDEENEDASKLQAHVLGFSLVETRNTSSFNEKHSVNKLSSGSNHNADLFKNNGSALSMSSLQLSDSSSMSPTTTSMKTLTIVEPVLSNSTSHSISTGYRDRDHDTPEAPKRKRGNNNRKIVSVNFVITYEGIQVLKEKFLSYQETEMTDEAVTRDDGL